MKPTPELKAILLGAIGALAAIGISFAAGEILQAKPSTASAPAVESIVPPANTVTSQGQKLFLNNCAHCHGADARGDEGPDLHGVTKSDARIASLIKNGIKGEMPKFSTKLSDTDVQALIAFVRTLKD